MIYLKRIPLAKLVWVRRLMLAAAMVGLFASTYLLITYISGKPIVCGPAGGCELVRASKWAWTFGIPRPALGIVFYLAIVAGLVYRAAYPHHKPRLWTNLTWVAAFIGFIESGFLTLVQWVDIKAFCLWCVTSAICATVIFVLSFFDTEETFDDRRSLHELKWTFGLMLASAAIGIFAMAGLLAPSNGGTLQRILPTGMVDIDTRLTPAGLPVEGPATSTVTVVEFIDFQCPSCGDFQPIMKKIREEYAGRIRFIQRQFPLTEIHPYAKTAAIAAVCAERQGKYFEYADALIANRLNLKKDDLLHYAGALHLDVAKMTACLDDKTALAEVEQGMQDGKSLDVPGTPTLFVNHERLDSIPSYSQLKAIIDGELSKK